MTGAPPSPRITHAAWGRLDVAGQERPFKDAKLFPGGARAWDWRETGTDHAAGIQPADVQELLEHGAAVIVLSRGRLGRLRVAPETLRLLESRGVRAHALRTGAAVRLYNHLAATEAVAGLFHSTC
jgi:hypothetical protein